MSINEVYMYIHENGIQEAIFILEQYTENQKEVFLQSGDHKLAENWKHLNYALFQARREAMIRQLT